jgi:hypothetical protein
MDSTTRLFQAWRLWEPREPSEGGVLNLPAHSLSPRLLGIGLIAVATPYMALAIHILRNPQWRRVGWPSRHPRTMSLLFGSEQGARFGAIFALIGGLVMVAVGIAALILG